jgi:aspartyl-tRNA(Asn)/glutamyl-tRNA(Gln) amidotransferase subunit A
MASSTDCIGFFTKAPEDMDLLMSIASGQDPKDLTTLPDYYNIAEADAESDDSRHASSRPSSRGSSLTRSQLVAKCLESSNSCARIGVIKDFDNESVDPEIRQALKKKCEALKKKGHQVVELSMPNLKYALAAYYIIVPAEVASNLSRYDVVRYGFRSEKSSDLISLYNDTRNEGFMPENKRRIMIGNFVLSSGFYDAYFLKAAKARTLIIKEYEEAFKKCDFILTPVSPNLAFKIGEKVNDPVSMYLEDVMSVPLNLAGIPGLTVPVGKSKEGLPVGLQLIGPRRSDKNLIEFAKELG